MKKTIQKDTLNNYLLGNISNDLAKKIDQELILNKDFEENMIIAEDLLIEDYLEGELTKEEVNLFHENFIISEERVQQVKTIAQLKNYSKNFDFGELLTEETDDEEDSIFQNLLNLFSMIPVRAFASVLIIGVVGSLTWLILIGDSNGVNGKELEYAKKNSVEISKSNNKEDLLLIDDTSRSDLKSNELIKNDSKKDFIAKVALRTKSAKDETYQVELLDGNKSKFTLREIIPVNNNVDGELWFILPVDELKLGQNRIKITSNKNAENKITYSFTVK